MDNLHAPTVPSGPTSIPVTNGGTSRSSLTDLQRKKENIEAELKALSGVLDSHGVNMNTSLLTFDGFPRADIDVAQIRTTRAQIIRLRNDYKDVMSTIEKHLHEHFANVDDSEDPEVATEASGANVISIPDRSLPQHLLPSFAKVNSVVPGSPAEQAGLEPADEIRVFGYVTRENHDNLKKVGECVQGNEGKPILVKVSRRGDAGQAQELSLTLTPRQGWGGRGLLGCHILPI